jgi:choline dehydrogenase
LETDYQARAKQVSARYEVIISAGSVTTAQLLMLSGVGPAEHLRQHQIDVIVDLPVGQRLQDHQEVEVHYMFPKDYTPHFDFLKEAPVFPSVAKWIAGKKSFLGSNQVPSGVEGSSKGPHSEERISTWHMHNLALGPLENADFHMVLAKESLEAPYRFPRSVAELFGFKGPFTHSHICELSGNHAYGRIELRNKDPLAQPLVDPRWGSSMEDNHELISCVKEVRRIMAATDPKYAGEEIGPCANATTDEQLILCVRNVVWGHHISGTAPMSCKSKYAVLDDHARVLGIEGLRVVDLSIVPELPHGNPTGVVLAFSEKIADIIKADYSGNQKK